MTQWTPDGGSKDRYEVEKIMQISYGFNVRVYIQKINGHAELSVHAKLTNLRDIWYDGRCLDNYEGFRAHIFVNYLKIIPRMFLALRSYNGYSSNSQSNSLLAFCWWFWLLHYLMYPLDCHHKFVENVWLDLDLDMHSHFGHLWFHMS
jgi:hypothetical protein